MKQKGFRKFIAERGIEAALLLVVDTIEEHEPEWFEKARRKFYPTPQEAQEDSNNA